MTGINETHDPELKSWVESANEPECDFPIQNLPLCVFRHKGGTPCVGVGIGDQIFEVADDPSLNQFMSLGRAAASKLRLEASHALRKGVPLMAKDRLFPIADCELLLPAQIGDYTDFYASIFHATNVGKMFRPENPLFPNYKYMPIGYHGRASSIVVSGTQVRRPSGQIQEGSAPPVFAPSRQVDYEGEVGFFAGPGNRLGEPIAIENAEDHLFGLCLVNDWSARDMQRWEYQPLGPFLSKSFATTISPWIVTLDALEPFRVARFQKDPDDPPPRGYLDCAGDRNRGGFAITLEVWLTTAQLREKNLAPVRLSQAQFEQMYWTPAQMLTHHTSNGCNLRPADLLASGTVSGPDRGSQGCLLELTQRGAEPIALPSGESRAFLEDGDEVILRGYAKREGFRRIGFGECRGTLMG